MKVPEAISRFDQLEKMIRKDLPLFIQERIAHDAVQMIHDRVVNQQKNFLGGQFSSYSKRPMLTSGKTEKSNRVGRALASSKRKRAELNWVTIRSGGKNVHLFELPGGYAQLRRMEGFSNTRKSFEFTTQMWRGFGVKRKRVSANTIIITLGGRNLESQKKIDANSQREGISIINISDSELAILAKECDKEIQRYVNKVGLS